MSNKPRTFVTVTGFTETEIEKLKTIATKRGLSMAAYIREITLKDAKLR